MYAQQPSLLLASLSKSIEEPDCAISKATMGNQNEQMMYPALTLGKTLTNHGFLREVAWVSYWYKFGNAIRRCLEEVYNTGKRRMFMEFKKKS